MSKPKFSFKTDDENKLDRELAWRRLKKYGVVQGENLRSIGMTPAFKEFAKSRLKYSVDQVFEVADWAKAAGYTYTYRVPAWLIHSFVGSKADIEAGDLANMAYLLSGVLELTEKK